MNSKHTPLGDLELIAGDIFDRWDKDMRSGKLLTALSGHLSPGYDPRVDRLRAALAAVPALYDALSLYVSICGNTCSYVSRETAGEMYEKGRAAIAKAEASFPDAS
jgi:hypothetical protein